MFWERFDENIVRGPPCQFDVVQDVRLGLIRPDCFFGICSTLQILRVHSFPNLGKNN